MTNFLLMVGAAARNELRWARQHLYFLLILGPLVLGFTVITVDQATNELPAFHPGQYPFFFGAVICLLALFAAGLSRAAGEVYHLDRPESAFESYPVRPLTHLLFAASIRFAHAVFFVAVILLARWRWTALPTGFWVLAGALLLAIMITLTEVLSGLAWIHWSHLRHQVAMTAALLCILTSAGIGGDLVGKFFFPELFAARRLPILAGIMLVWCTLLGIAVWRLHRRWRARDIEFALRLGRGKVRSVELGRRFADRFGRVVYGLFRRDLALTVRVFSSTVYVSAALLILIAVLLLVVIRSGMLPDQPNPYGPIGGSWLVPVLAVKAACVLGLLAVMAITPVLVSYQLPHLWLERSAGTRGQELWTAKLYFTRFVTLPVPVLIWAVGIASGASPANYALPLLLECLGLWWMLTTIVGSLAFEIPDRPGLALLLTNLLGFGAGMLLAWLWPVGIVVYVFGAIRTLRDRGISRAEYCLLVGES